MSLTDEFEQYIGNSGRDFAIAKARHLAESLAGVAGSPIEIQVACLIACWLEGFGFQYSVVRSEEDVVAGHDYYLWPQHKIGPYRVDFVVGKRGGNRCIVECDGRDFHHSTREQIERDRARDAALASMGWKVLRFPGTQIYNDPFHVVGVIFAEVDHPAFQDAAKKYRRVMP